MSVQTFKSIPLSNRKTLNFLVLFKPAKKAESRSIYAEMVILQNDDIFNLLSYVYQKPYYFMVLDRDNNEIYRNFNKIIKH